MAWLQPQRKHCYADFLKVFPNKNEGQKTISPNFASNRNILSAITPFVEESGKSKTIVFISDY